MSKQVTNKNDYLEAAADVGIRLCRDAIWENDRCNWISFDKDMDANNNEIPYFRTLDANIYTGTSGIALFLISLYKVDNNPIFYDTALGALNQALSIRQKQKEHLRVLLGFHTGWTGIAYTSILAGKTLNEKSYVETGLEMIEELTTLDITKFGLDVIDGCAGAIPILIKIQKEYESEGLYDFIHRIGEHLLETADKESFGWSWKTVAQADNNLTGLAHGVAGMLNALFELYHFTGDKKYHDAAYQGLNYEKHFFSEEEQNWPDFRNFDGKAKEPTYPCLWCHGAAGIGFSRLRAFEITKDQRLEEESNIAIQTTIKQTGFENGQSASLCHGIFGNADLLLYAGKVFNEPKFTKKALKLGKQGIEKFLKKDIPMVNGLHNTYQIPGLMLGLAGMGYFFLRLYDNNVFPSILINRSEGAF